MPRDLNTSEGKAVTTEAEKPRCLVFRRLVAAELRVKVMRVKVMRVKVMRVKVMRLRSGDYWALVVITPVSSHWSRRVRNQSSLLPVDDRSLRSAVAEDFLVAPDREDLPLRSSYRGGGAIAEEELFDAAWVEIFALKMISFAN
jgi:hypothetical protein